MIRLFPFLDTGLTFPADGDVMDDSGVVLW